ncbi:MAG: xanthine dehydrogenase family protein molybdopterin-binding subunit [Rhodospirillaceae bacterium]|jgi:CO/xanthine dehydrogenase Mo-binding subunit|nr:xanthine dehydrogenase family protein molybdopterin-binding subunit [Rhodospirillaceae bacterium]MBT5080785.1 xanthine dehydrogenase family protein molybdopterin-binding subunit [Rhodospirillaceae bacterium]MBT5525207.1 xanthine dehydrogenase family protein molybdopterin-binding subunit [Rhodospirillaceae bacterium]MBT5877776.1 xanthine dehydrogenase family protein molybdopterin-binding subunit [Rhodospirillaceae bacterium]MBT6592122.1 xanthine dehydrogenase family protein molybdopterin-bind
MNEQPKQFKWVGTRAIRPDGVDKVTGRAMYGADLSLPGMVEGKVVRSPHAHARIISIDTSKAEALNGVTAVITAADMPVADSKPVASGEAMINFKDLANNVLAREKALYEGQAVAAVAAKTADIAEQAAALIVVNYEVLPHVIDVMEAIKEDAPVLHDDMFTGGVKPKPEKASNVANRVEFALGDADAGFAAADLVIERQFTTEPVHQGYIEPHAVVADMNPDGKVDVFCSSQGHFMVRAFCSQLLHIEMSKIKVTAAEIGGGFGGKTTVYLEPLAIMLSRKSGRPVRMTMSREEVFRGSGATSGAAMTIKMGATKDGKITGAYAELYLQAGAFPGSPVGPAAMTAFAPYDLANVKVVGFDVVSNRQKVVAYRAPGAPISEYGVESVVDELASELGIDPIEIRSMNGAKEGTQAAYGVKFGTIGFQETLDAAKATEHFKTPLGPNQGRGVASGFWFNIGGESCAGIRINEDGSISLTEGSPDIGGSRASMALMAAETLGVDYNKIKPSVVDTDATGYHFVTGGSRVTFATGMAVVEASKAAIDELRARAAQIWDVDVEGVVWEDGHAKPASTNVGDFEPMSLAELAKVANKTGGPISGHADINAKGAGPAFGTHICDVEVDPDTGHVTVLRYTAVQDAGRAIHPGYVEGQIQGGAVQGIGWALNEEYIYDENGCLENAGFLDYRVPVASDLPMIDAIIVEVPNPTHPFGVRGVGEVPIIPPLAAVSNAVAAATGVRFNRLPLSPPTILAGIAAKK